MRGFFENGCIFSFRADRSVAELLHLHGGVNPAHGLPRDLSGFGSGSPSETACRFSNSCQKAQNLFKSRGLRTRGHSFKLTAQYLESHPVT